MNIEGSGEAQISLKSIKWIPRRPNLEQTCLLTESLHDLKIVVIVSSGSADPLLLEGLELGWIFDHARTRPGRNVCHYIPTEIGVQPSCP